MPTVTQLAPTLKQQFFSPDGVPLADGYVYAYGAGGITPATTYADATGLTANPWPLRLDAGGFANLWLDVALRYKFVVTDINGVIQYTVDDVEPLGGPAGSIGPAGVSGYSGFSGISGYSGSVPGGSGYSGYSGFSGISGYSGFVPGGSGASGFSGFSGISGWSGLVGTSGFSGISGYSGTLPGTSGFSGYSGTSGWSGAIGPTGTSGFSGWSGISGYSGAVGASGTSGFSGISGYSGAVGISGTSGYSGISGYSGNETYYNAGSGTAFTINLANGSLQKLTTTGPTTITLPASVAGSSYTVVVAFGGAHALTWAGGTVLKWQGGVVPPTSTGGKTDAYVFFCDGASTFGSSGGYGWTT